MASGKEDHNIEPTSSSPVCVCVSGGGGGRTCRVGRGGRNVGDPDSSHPQLSLRLVGSTPPSAPKPVERQKGVRGKRVKMKGRKRMREEEQSSEE